MGFSHLSHLECSECATTHDADEVAGLCACGAPLLARYDLDAVRGSTPRTVPGGREATLWRYHEVLPVRDPRHVVTLGEGMTPLLPLPRYGASVGVPGLMLKDEGLVPTGSFKARGAAVGVSRASELGVRAVAMPTNGNAGAAWSVYAARAGIRSFVAMPVDAPLVTRVECVAAGAELVLVRGLISDAGRMVAEAVADSGGDVQDVSTLKEPYRIEGKKTMGYEIAEQYGWRPPDVVVYPTGGGVGLIGIHKAMAEMRALGWLEGPPPRLVAVQSTGCAPVVAAYESGADACEPWPDAQTVAYGLTVPAPLGGRLILRAVRESGGCAVAVDDADTLHELASAARLDGVFCCPEGAATLAAVRRLRESGWIGDRDSVLVLNTGAGNKYPETVTVDVSTMEAGDSAPWRRP